MAESIIAEKAYDFSNRIVKLEVYLRSQHNEYMISKQIFRCGTSIGANTAEAVFAQSDADFVSKHQIALKEANETRFWLRLLHDNSYINDEMFNSLLTDVNSIISILISIINSMKDKMERASR